MSFGLLRSQTTSPVSVSWVRPTNTSTVFGRITLTATAASLAAPIDRVEFYDVFATTNASGIVTWQTNLIGIATNADKMTTPKSLFVY